MLAQVVATKRLSPLVLISRAPLTVCQLWSMCGLTLCALAYLAASARTQANVGAQRVDAHPLTLYMRLLSKLSARIVWRVVCIVGNVI